MKEKPHEMFPVTWGDWMLLGVALLGLLRGLSVATEAERSGFDEGLEVFTAIALAAAVVGGGATLYQLRHPLDASGRARTRARNIRLILVLAPFLGLLGASLDRWGSAGFKVAFYALASGFMLLMMLVYVGYNVVSRTRDKRMT